MKRILTGVWAILLLYSMGYADFHADTAESKLQFDDSAGKGKLMLGTSIGDGSATFYKGTVDVSDAYLDRRIQSNGDATKYIYLNRATVITGTSRAYVSARYENEVAGADQLDRYTLDDSSDLNFIRFEPGQAIRELVIGDGSNAVGTAYVQGAPFLFKPIRLEAISNAGNGNSHIVRWGLTGKLNQPIVLPALSANLTETTQFILDSNMELGDGVAFLPQTGTYPATIPELRVTFSNSKLSLGGEDLTWRSTLLLEKAQDIELNANLNLDATWLFSGNAMIQGNGNILDLSGRDANTNGTIGVDVSSMINNSNTTTIFLRDIKLRLRNGALFLHERNVLDLSNVEIELENTVNFTSGNIRISGPTMIYAKNYTFSVSNGATMTVDGTVLYYDSGQHYNKKGVFPNDVLDDDKTVMGEALNFQHDGYIQMIEKPEVTLLVTPGNNSGANIGNIDGGAGTSAPDPFIFTSDKDMWLSGDVQLIFDNVGNTGDERFYHFDGDNHFLHLARESNCIIIHTNTRVSFVDTVFKDFDPTAFQLQGSGNSKGQIFFGQGCVLEFGADVELGTATDSLYTLSIQVAERGSIGTGIPGDENIVTINGQGHRLSFPYAGGQSTPGQIMLFHDRFANGIRLDLENITIDKLGGWPRRLEADHSIAQICSVQHTNTVLYRNAQLNLSNNYSYSHGSMIIDGIVQVDTRRNVDTSEGGNTNNVFIFQPARQSVLTLSHNAQLKIGSNVTFSVDPIITDGITIGNAGTVEYDAPYKSIVFDDDTAVIHMNASTLHVTATGLYFQKGAVDIENDVTWFAGIETHGNDEQRILLNTSAGNETSINMYAGATLNMQGPVHYRAG